MSLAQTLWYAGAKTHRAPRPGGDDLEDDDYYEPDDVPSAHADVDGTEDNGTGVRGKVAGRAAPKKKAKIVMF